MKVLTDRDFVLKIAAVLFITVTLFYIGKHWNTGYQHLIFFSPRQAQSPSVGLSPNLNKSFNISALISFNHMQSPPFAANTHDLAHFQPPPTSPPIETFGIVDENGIMSENFEEVGEFDSNVVVDNWGGENETEVEQKDESGYRRTNVQKFGLCPTSMSEYIPCLDNVQAIKRLKSTERGEKFERHCPEPGRGMNCLVPAPKNYKTPIPWPKSRDEVIIFPFS